MISKIIYKIKDFFLGIDLVLSSIEALKYDIN